MRIIQDNAESKLLEELRQFWEHNRAMRCLRLRPGFEDYRDDNNDIQELILQELNRCFDDPELKTYLCHDGDLFIISRILTHKRLKDFLAHLAPKLPPALSLGSAALFEIGVDWWRLQMQLNKKIEILKALQANSKTKSYEQLSKISRDETFGRLDRDLISSLAMRRDQRAEAEIMVVEDDIFSQRLVGNALKGHYKVTITCDGQGAVMSYIKKAPDVLFLDIGLPDIDGHDVLQKIFDLDPAAYVVMFSGNGSKHNILKAMELGAKGFVGKPFTQAKLLHYIEHCPFIQRKNEIAGVI